MMDYACAFIASASGPHPDFETSLGCASPVAAALDFACNEHFEDGEEADVLVVPHEGDPVIVTITASMRLRAKVSTDPVTLDAKRIEYARLVAAGAYERAREFLRGDS